MSTKLSRIVFIICAIYFFMMGFGLIFFPGLIIKGFSDNEVNPIIIGMLRGAGGSIIPYSLLYILIIINPFGRLWSLLIILFANITAITLDIVSLLLDEYKLLYAMLDIPIEVLSLLGIWIIWSKRKKMEIK